MIVKFFIIVGVMAITYYIDCLIYSDDRRLSLEVSMTFYSDALHKRPSKKKAVIEKLLAIYRSTPFFYWQTREQLCEAAQQDPELAAAFKAGRYVQTEKAK